MKTRQMTRPVNNSNGICMYSFVASYETREQARERCIEEINNHAGRHAYYTKIMENGEPYFHVRLENP